MRNWLPGFVLAVAFLLFAGPSAQAQWMEADIGGSMPVGYGFDGWEIEVYGGGAGMGGTSDQFFFFYEEAVGDDITLIAQLTGLLADNPAVTTQAAGLMIRDSLNADSANAAIMLNLDFDNGGADGLWRDVAGADTQDSTASTFGDGFGLYDYLRVTRSGDQFDFAVSTDSVNWTSYGAQTVQMGGSVFIGIAVTSDEQDVGVTAYMADYEATGNFTKVTAMFWDGSGNGNWGDPSRWDDLNGSPTNLAPDQMTNTTVDVNDTISVLTDQTTNKLTMTAGTLDISPNVSFTAGGVIDIAEDIPVILGANATFSTGGGNMGMLITDGNATLGATSALNLVAIDTQDSVGTFTKTGPGNLTPLALSAANTHFVLEGGMFDATSPDGLGGATEITLAGGGLRLKGEASLVPNTLAAWFYNVDNGQPDTIEPIDSGVGILTREPDFATTLTGPLSFADGTMPGLFNMPADDFAAVWHGTMTVGGNLPAGDISIAMRSDDGNVFYIDLNDNGLFEIPDELIVEDNSTHAVQNIEGTINLEAGTYRIATGFYERGGGDIHHVKVGAGTGLLYDDAAMSFINPTDPAQDGIWSGMSRLSVDLRDLNIEVSNGGTLDVVTDGQATVGPITLSGGILATMGAKGGFVFEQGVTIPGDTPAGTVVGFSPEVDSDYGEIRVNGAAVVIAKDGPGTWALETAPTDLQNASWEVRGGTLEAAAVGALGDRPVTVTGGQLLAVGAAPLGNSEVILDGGELTIINNQQQLGGPGLQERWFSGDFDDSQLTPIDSGAGFLTMAPDAYNVLDTALSFDGAAMTERSGGAVGVNNVGAVWYGQVNIGGDSPLAAGRNGFGLNTDDGGMIWVDVDQSGTFDAGEIIVDTRGNHGALIGVGAVDLAEGSYDIAFGYYENTGGELAEMKVFMQTPPPDAMLQANAALFYSVSPLVDPSSAAQAGLWTAYESTPLAMTDRDLTVLSDSSLSASTGSAASFGQLALGGVLTTRGAYGGISFTGTTLSGATGGFDTVVDTNPGVIDGGAAAATLVKTGAASLVIDQAGVGLQNATFDVQEGAIVPLVGAASFGGGAVNLSGGELLLTSTGGDVTVDQAVSVSTSGTITAGSGGIGVAGPVTATLGSAANGVTVDLDAIVTMGSTDNYTLNVAGPLAGDGSLKLKEGIIDFTGGGGIANIVVGDDAAITSGPEGIAVSESLMLGSTTYTVDSGALVLNSADASGAGNVLTLNGSTVTVETPSGIELQNMLIGNTGGVYSYDVATGIHTMSADGHDIWDASDDFHFAYAELSGDAEIIAHVLSIEDEDAPGTRHTWSKSGVMIRDKLTGPSMHRFIATTGNNGTPAQGRAIENDGGSTMNIAAGGGYQAPRWVRLVLDSATNTIEQYRSADAGDTPVDQINWEHVDTGADATVDWADDTYYIGLALTSHETGNLHISDIEQVSINGIPAGLSSSTGVNQPMTDLIVTATSTMYATGVTPAVFGDVVLDSGVNLTVLDSPGLSAQDIHVSQAATITTNNLMIRGSLFAGNEPGILSTSGEVTMADGAVFSATLLGAAGADKLMAGGDVDLGTNATLEIPITADAPFKAGTYTLIDSSAAETGVIGQFVSMTDLGSYVGANALQHNEYDVKLTIDLDLHPGDADLSTATDLTDFNLWNANKFTAGTDWTQGDFNGDGQTDLSDFNIWNANKFTTASGGAAPTPTQVPEPGTLALLACGLLGLLLAWRRRSV